MEPRKGEFKGTGPRTDGCSKGKGKKGQKGRPKTPQELGFRLSSGGELWVRQAQLCGGQMTAEGVEVGNLDEKKLAGKGKERPGLGLAEVEVLCNRQSLLGNPFNLGKKVKLEALRGPVLDAYADYLDEVLGGAEAVDIPAVARRHRLTPEENCGKDWRAIYDASSGPAGVRKAIAELQGLASSMRGLHGAVRLLCHCAPLPCHTQILAGRLRPAGPAVGAPEEGAAQPPLRSLDGSWALKGDDAGTCLATIQGDSLRWPSGAEAPVRAEGDGWFSIQIKSGTHRAHLRGSDLVWDDGSIWVPMSVQAVQLGKEGETLECLGEGQEGAAVRRLERDFARKLRMDGAPDAEDPSQEEAARKGSGRLRRWGAAAAAAEPRAPRWKQDEGSWESWQRCEQWSASVSTWDHQWHDQQAWDGQEHGAQGWRQKDGW